MVKKKNKDPWYTRMIVRVFDIMIYATFFIFLLACMLWGMSLIPKAFIC